jgi:hypothetical protein
MKLVELDERKSYITTASEKEIRSLVQLKAPVILLTPHKSKCTGLDDLAGDSLRATPAQLLQRMGEIAVPHVLVEECELMAAYGYTEDLELLSSRFSFVVLNAGEAPSFVRDAQVLNTRRCFIRLGGDDRYIAVFVLCKIYSRALVVCNNPRRVELFAEILGLDCRARSHRDEMDAGTRVCILMDRMADVECEKLFYIGNRCGEIEEMYFDMGKAGKYIHRVRCVCEALTPAVVSGRKELNRNRFININK